MDINFTTTTRIASLLNIDVLITIDWNFVVYFGFLGGESLILNRNSQIMVKVVLISFFSQRFDNRLVLSEFRFSFIKIDNHVFFGHNWSLDYLRVIKVSWSFDRFDSQFLLDNWLCDLSFIFLNVVFIFQVLDFQGSLFNDWFDDRLINVFDRIQGILSDSCVGNGTQRLQ